MQKTMPYFLLFLLLMPAMRGWSQQETDVCLSAAEIRLYQWLNAERKSNGKALLEPSVSLALVAKAHVQDLRDNHPDTSVCGLSSWSDKGQWTACCYTPYVYHPDCMYDKPKEITSYPYRGYELVLYHEDRLETDSIIALIAGSSESMDMILTDGLYDKKDWKCVGLASNEHYTSIWFGQRADKAGGWSSCDPSAKGTPKAVASTSRFYLIMGSFETEKEARKMVRTLKDSGITEAGMILRKEGMYSVYLGAYPTIKTANMAKNSMSNQYPDAWILKQ